jgi:hypothetical protein
MHTTADLRNRDLPVTVAAQATGTFDGRNHPAEAVQEFSLQHLQRILGDKLDYGNA